MKNYLGEIINRVRARHGLTQDHFGQRYKVSGPAIFKFEKGYVKPSLKLWLEIAQEAGVPERRAVLLWIKSKLPSAYQDYVELQSAAEEIPVPGKRGRGIALTDYTKVGTREDMLIRMDDDMQMPLGLRDLVKDDELWALYKPTGDEINKLRDIFMPIGNGSKDLYRQALLVLREFAES